MVKTSVVDMLPHGNEMVWIDDVIDYDIKDKWLKSTVTITEDKMMYDKDISGISSAAGIEFMAQTIGCYAYYRNGEKPVKVGFLLGTRNFKREVEYFKKDETYSILVKEIFFDNNIVSFECFIYNQEDREISSAIVNVYHDDELKEDFKHE